MLKNLSCTSAPSLKSMQRARGRAEVGFNQNGLCHLYQSGSAKVLLPKTYGAPPLAVFINSAGGVTGGDRFAYLARAEKDTTLCATSQTAERIYKASSQSAEINTELAVAENATLEWMPQETILYEGSCLSRTIRANMKKTARLLVVESIILGRGAMGEILENVSFSDHWRIRVEEKLVFADAFKLFPPLSKSLGSGAGFTNGSAFANLVYIGPDAGERVNMARSLMKFDNVKAAASAWNDILAVRFLSQSPQDLKVALAEFLTRFRGGEMPRLWHI